MSTTGGLSAERGLTLLRRLKPNIDAWMRLLRRSARVDSTTQLFSRTARVLLGAIVAGVVAMPIVMVAMDAWGSALARTLPAAVHIPFGTITDFGKSGWFLWPIGLVLIALGLLTSPAIGRITVGVVTALAVRLTFVFAAIAVPGLFATIIKRLIGRARPFVGNATADPYHFDPFVWHAAYAGLPSGHATTAFAAAVAIGAAWPKTRVYVWGYAALIALSRVVVTAHYPSDVIAGAIVGTAGAVLVRNWFAVRRLGFTIDAGGHVRRLPGPSWRRVRAAIGRLRDLAFDRP